MKTKVNWFIFRLKCNIKLSLIRRRRRKINRRLKRLNKEIDRLKAKQDIHFRNKCYIDIYNFNIKQGGLNTKAIMK